MKMCPVGTEFLYAERRMDMNLIVAFRQFENKPKNASAWVGHIIKLRGQTVWQPYFKLLSARTRAANFVHTNH